MSISRDIAPLSKVDIASLIHIIHEKPVVFDFDMASLYKMETKELNRIVNRNADFFPNDFRFKLTKNEFNSLFPEKAKTEKPPYVYTEQGIVMLALVLKDVESSVSMIRAFVEMRNFVAKNAPLFERISSIELKQLEFEKETKLLLSRINEIKKRESQKVLA